MLLSLSVEPVDHTHAHFDQQTNQIIMESNS